MDLAVIVGTGVILGVVQGISEWLPISSKTQIILVSTILLGLTFGQGYTLGLFLEFGTFFAAVVYFWREILVVLKTLVGRGGSEGKLLLKYLFVVTLITGIMGVFIYLGVESLNLGSAIGVPTIALGAVLILDGLFIRYSRRRVVQVKGLENLSLRELLFVGFTQGLSAFPGVSRSGATVSALLIIGTNPQEAFKLSFLALIPASIGATAVTVLFSKSSLVSGIANLSPETILVALIVTFLVGSLMIRWLIRVAAAEKITTLVFALGAVAIFGGILGILFGGTFNLS